MIQRKELIRPLQVAWPIIAGNLSSVLLQVFDNIMVGRLGAHSLAAATLANSVFVIPLVFGLGISMALPALTAMKRGSGNTKGEIEILANGLLVNLVTGILLLALSLATGLYMHKLNPNPEIVQLSSGFYTYICLSILPLMLFMTFKQVADGMEILKPGLWIGILSVPLNVLLNWLLIYGHWGLPQLGLEGSGVATLITRCCMVVAILLVYSRHSELKTLFKLGSFHRYFKTEAIGRILKLGIPGGFQYTFEAGAFAVSSLMIGWIGATEMAAHQIAINMASVTYMVSLGLSGAGAILVGHAYGAGDYVLMRRSGVLITALGIGFMAITALVFLLFHAELPYLYIQDEGVISVASRLLIIAAIFQFSDSIQAIAGGLLRGMDDARIPTLFILIAYWVIGIPVGYYLAFPLHWGVDGIWYGFVAGLTAASVLLVYRFWNLASRRIQQKEAQG